MANTSTKALVSSAAKGGYAVAAFNVFDNLSLESVVRAASEASSPVIVQVSVRTAVSIGIELVKEMFDAAVERWDGVATLHLDHCPDMDVARAVVDAGWTSLLFDVSHLDFESASAQTGEISEYAHARGVELESEIENIGGVEDGVGGGELVHAYSDATLVQFCEDKGVDLIAPHLGTAHGLYTEDPVLRFERVPELRKLTALPLVLHGGTGLSEEDFRRFIDAGVSKVNISTALKRAYMESMLKALQGASAADKWEPLVVFDEVASDLRSTVSDYLKMFGSFGKA